MRVVCYTCITGNYDKLIDPVMKSPGIDYICFSDSDFKSNIWKIRQIPDELDGLSKVKQQRIVKICPHKFLPEYDVSIWVDGNIEIIGELNDFISQYDLTIPLYTRIHPTRNCIYDEADACINLGKGNVDQIKSQVNSYADQGYPKRIGMAETNILVRDHNDIHCKLVCNAWATELLLNSHRDQLSFNYVCWKNHFLPGYLINEFDMRNNKFFRLRKHG